MEEFDAGLAGEQEPREDDDMQEEAVLITPDMLHVEEKYPRIDFEKEMSYLPWSVVVLILITVAVFTWEVATGALASARSMIAAGALYRPLVLQGQVWRLFTAMFLHASFDHLFGNCVMLYILGMACEHALGVKQTLVVYFFSGLCGSILSIAARERPSVGASGAIFGVMCAVIMILYRYQKFFIVRNKRVGFVLLLWGGYSIITGFLTPYIDNFCHVGGFVGGGIAALFLHSILLPTATAEVEERPAESAG